MFPSTTPTKPADRIRASLGLLTWALWFGLLTGYLELINLGVRKYVFGHSLLLGRHTLWLAPLATSAFFLLLGVLLIPLMIAGPRRSQSLAVFLLGFTLVASVLLLHGEIHRAASAMLAAGVAARMARSISARPDGFARLVRRTLPWMTAAAVGSAALLPAWWAWSESRAIAALPNTASDAPNVLLVVWDTVRAKSLSTYGYARNTSPNLTGTGKEGIVFEHAVAPSSWTLPSHASMFTGRWPDELSTMWGASLDRAYPTLAEVLTAKGYATAGFVANQYIFNYEFGLSRGFLHYEDFNVLGTEFLLSCEIGRRLATSERWGRWFGRKDFFGRKSAERVNKEFLRWMDSQRKHPFFAFLNYYDAHHPYQAPPPFDERYSPGRGCSHTPVVAGLRHADVVTPEPVGAALQKAEQDAYDETIAYLDSCFGRLLSELKARGRLDNTLLILTSDHGEQMGEHGLRNHGNSLYRSLLHVPLMIRFRGRIPSCLRPRQVVSLRDLPATVLDLLGYGNGRELAGSSWKRCWDGTQPDGDRGPVVYASLGRSGPDGRPDQRLDAVIVDGLYYIRFEDGREELYDFLNDPLEANELSRAAGMQTTLARFRTRLPARSLKRRIGREWLAASEDADRKRRVALAF